MIAADIIALKVGHLLGCLWDALVGGVIINQIDTGKLKPLYISGSDSSELDLTKA